MARDIHIVRSVKTGAVVDGVVECLEAELSRATGWPVADHKSGLFQKLARRSFALPVGKKNPVFMVMMGTYRIPLNAADWLGAATPRVAWLFDAWPGSHEDLCLYVTKYGLTHLFVTASQVAEVLGGRLEHCRVEWMPEPLVDLGFASVPWNEKSDTVIQFGRKFDPYHEALMNGLGGASFNYEYERIKGEVVHKTTEEFVRALGRAKISVCFPSDVTHPERAGGVSTLTQRFLQSMASGCVIVGQSPPELVRLFGYDPVVPADRDDPVGQIEHILSFPEKWLESVERNQFEVKSHTVAQRIKKLKEMLP